jgi:ubiquinone/menaquinone biosynthesis C-methylase UbiE
MSDLATQSQRSHALNDKATALSSRYTHAASVSVQDGYKRWAETYDKTPNPLLALEERHLAGLLPNLVGSKVLDLACGTGRWLAPLLSRGARAVVGIDFSAAMLGVARSSDRVRDCLVLADGLQLPFQASVFDFVLSSFALNHFEDLQSMAQELARAMKLEGRLLLSEMHPDACARGWRPGFRDIRGSVQIKTLSHPAQTVISCFRSNGFAFLGSHDLFFAEPERPIFLASAKAGMFDRVCHFPAIQVYEFRKIEREPSEGA